MRVFISWSGSRSGKTATALQGWIPKIIQAARPWTSSASIEAGARWSTEVGQALSDIDVGVLCLTPENLSAPWVLFEAGALSKALTSSRVIPYLLGFDARELQGPLAQFQAVKADRDGTFRLVSTINIVMGDRAIAPDVLAETFDIWWPRFEPVLHDLATAVPSEKPQPARTVDDMLGEVLDLLRSQRADGPAETAVPATALYEAIPFEAALSFGERLRTLRTTRHLTPSEMAWRTGISIAVVRAIESGIYYPKPWEIVRLARELGIAAEELTGPA